MHLQWIVAVLAIYTPLVSAFAHLEARANACQKQVNAGPSSDCASYLSKTVTPCASTIMSTTTSTITVGTSTRTYTAHTTRTRTFTDTAYQTIDQTQVITEQATDYQTVGETTATTTSSTSTLTTTTTLLVTATVTSTYSSTYVVSTVLVTTTLPAPQKRDAAATDFPIPPLRNSASIAAAALSAAFTSAAPEPSSSANALEARAVCVPKTGSASLIATYASACHRAVVYSSACSVKGLTEQTTTLTTDTVYATTTKTQTSTPISPAWTTRTFVQYTTVSITKPVTNLHSTTTTLTTTKTSTITSTITVTSSYTTVVSQYDSTTTSTKINSVVATSTSLFTSTVTATPTPCPGSFTIEVSSGTAPGSYLDSSWPIQFSQQSSTGPKFALDSQSRLYEVSTGKYANIDPSAISQIYLDTQNDIETNGANWSYVTCSTVGSVLLCSTSLGSNHFYYCTNAGLKWLISSDQAASAQGAQGGTCSLLKMKAKCTSNLGG